MDINDDILHIKIFRDGCEVDTIELKAPLTAAEALLVLKALDESFVGILRKADHRVVLAGQHRLQSGWYIFHLQKRKESTQATQNTMLNVLYERMLRSKATVQRSDQVVGAYVYNSQLTNRNADVFFDSKLPAGPSARELEAFISSLPDVFRKAYQEEPPGGFSETADAMVLNPLLFRAIAAWLNHKSLDKDNGPGTELLQDTFSRVMPQYWAARAKRESKAAPTQRASHDAESQGFEGLGAASAAPGSLPDVLEAGNATSSANAASLLKSASTSAPELLGVLPCGYLRDTHAKGLTNPSQQPNRHIGAGEQVLWASTVMGVEDKSSLKPRNMADSGRGQLKKTASRVFLAQGKRAFMMGLLMSCQEVEIWYFNRNETACCSPILDLSLSSSSAGLQMLFRLLGADASQLGYFPPLMPPPFVSGGVSFSAFECIAPWGWGFSAEPPFQTIKDFKMQRHTGREVFSAKASRDGHPPEDVVIKFHSEAAKEAQTIASLEKLARVPRVLAHGKGPQEWPDFLAITPKAVHYSALEHDPATILRGMRDTALTLRDIVACGVRHGDVTPGNAMAVEDINGMLQLLLTDFHGAGPLGSESLPTTRCFSAYGLGLGEKPSLLTDLEAAYYTFLHIVTREGLLWAHKLMDMDAVKGRTMADEFRKQLDPCIPALKPVFGDLRKLFFLGKTFRYRPPLGEDDARKASEKFAAICDKHLQQLAKKKKGPSVGKRGGRTKKPSSPTARRPIKVTLPCIGMRPLAMQPTFQPRPAQKCSCPRVSCHVKLMRAGPVLFAFVGI